MSQSALINVIVFSEKGLPDLKSAFGQLKTMGRLEKCSAIYSIKGKQHTPDHIHDIRSEEKFVGLSVSLRIDTDLPALQLRKSMEEIESQLTSKVNRRVLEIILVAYGEETLMSPQLTLPYPDLLKRPEISVPSSEVWRDYYHPIYKENLLALAKRSSQGSWGEFFAHGQSALDF